MSGASLRLGANLPGADKGGELLQVSKGIEHNPSESVLKGNESKCNSLESAMASNVG